MGTYKEALFVYPVKVPDSQLENIIYITYLYTFLQIILLNVLLFTTLLHDFFVFPFAAIAT